MLLVLCGKGKLQDVESQKLTRYKAKNTLLGVETPSLNNKLYPFFKKWINLLEKYCEMMPENVYRDVQAFIDMVLILTGV